MNIIYEEFPSIKKLLSTLDSRENNDIMRYENSSNSGSKEFTGTSNYHEATELLRYGDEELLKRLNKELKNFNKINANEEIRNRTVKSMPIGYVPNVPNALANKPDSMINVLQDPRKQKAISIIYVMGGSCAEEEEFFIHAGAALISMLQRLELHGVRVKLLLSFMPSYENEEAVFPVLRLKDFSEKFNIMKLAFPLVHPSMFRRIGFKYLETCPYITDDEFRFGYGKPLRNFEDVKVEKNTYLISSYLIRDYDYKLEELFKEKFNILF